MKDPKYHFDLNSPPPTTEVLENERRALRKAKANQERSQFAIILFDFALLVAVVLAFHYEWTMFDQLNIGTLLLLFTFTVLMAIEIAATAKKVWPVIAAAWVLIIAVTIPYLNPANVVVLGLMVTISVSVLAIRLSDKRIGELDKALVNLEPVNPNSHRNLLLRLGEGTPPAMEMQPVRDYCQAVARLHRDPVVGEVEAALETATALRDPTISKAKNIYHTLSGTADTAC